jgi:hypothetical protein
MTKTLHAHSIFATLALLTAAAPIAIGASPARAGRLIHGSDAIVPVKRGSRAHIVKCA